MIIERPTGRVEVHDNGIIHNQYDPGVTILGSHAHEEMALFEEIAEGFGGRMLLLNDLRERVSADREARAVYGQYSNANAYIAFVFSSKFVEMGFNFIQRVHGMDVEKKTFQEIDPAMKWLASHALT